MEINDQRLRRQLDLALGILDALEPDLKPGVDFAACIQAAIRSIRGAGSRDRRFYREVIYTWLRYREWIDPARNSNRQIAGSLLVYLAGETKELLQAKTELPDPLRDSPPPTPDEAASRLSSFDPAGNYSVESLIPDWLADEFPSETTPLPHTMRRPPIWIRTSPDTATEIAEFLRENDITASVQPDVPGALSVPTDTILESTRAYQTGRFEIQDIGSQAVLAQVGPKNGEHWFDACAGAGGKSLQLANLVGNTGKVTATDTRPKSLEALRARARRAGHGNLIILEPRNAKAAELLYDGVLVDAPCSGSGTWRRRPFLRHQTNLEVIRQYARTQHEILTQSARRVRPRGRLVYATCSLCRTENEDVIQAFLKKHDDFHPDPIPNHLSLTELAPGRFLILPERFDGDAFYLAVLRRS